LQAAIKKEFGVTADLTGGHSGVFDVTIDGTLVYSKDQTFRFPTNEEIFAKVREHQKG
jgi:selT/selW/selH-like putative selenoprotein